MVTAEPLTWQHSTRMLRVMQLQQGPYGRSLVTSERPWSPTVGLVMSLFRSRSSVFAAWDDGTARGVAHVVRRPRANQWDIVYLALAPEVPGATTPSEHYLMRLLDGVFVAAKEERTISIFVRVPEGLWVETPLRRAGFTALTREHRMVRHGPYPRLAPRIPGLRRQERRDAWALHQLYLRTTPQAVRNAESRTSRDWEVSPLPPRFLPRSLQRLVEDESGIIGWMKQCAGAGKSQYLQCRVAANCQQLARDLVALALADASTTGATEVHARVPEYANEVRAALEDNGFQEVGCDLVMVRTFAIRAHMPALRAAVSEVASGLRT
jgi:hypothetical protein